MSHSIDFTQPAIQIQDLVKYYNPRTMALKGINLSIQTGDCFALLGPNGAGKSTTIGILTSLVAKTSGKVWIHGIDIDKDFSSAKRLVGVVPQEFNFNIFESVLQIVTNQAGYYGISYRKALPRAKHYLQQLDLWEERNTKARFLSGGFKRRLMIARGLIHNPKILILDEPTANIDVEIRRSILAFIKMLNTEGMTVILTTHYLEEAENLCNQVAIINQGKIVLHTPMHSLIKQLDSETFLLNVDHIPDTFALPDFTHRIQDGHVLEVELKKPQSLNALLSALTVQQITVQSLKNKANRLEELFIHMTTKKT